MTEERTPLRIRLKPFFREKLMGMVRSGDADAGLQLTAAAMFQAIARQRLLPKPAAPVGGGRGRRIVEVPVANNEQELGRDIAYGFGRQKDQSRGFSR